MKIKDILLENTDRRIDLSNHKVKKEVYQIIDDIADTDMSDLDLDEDDVVDALRDGYDEAWTTIFRRVAKELNLKFTDEEIGKYYGMSNNEFRKRIENKDHRFYDYFLDRLQDTRAWEKTVDYDFVMVIQQEVNAAAEGPEEFIQNGGLESKYFGHLFDRYKIRNNSSNKQLDIHSLAQAYSSNGENGFIRELNRQGITGTDYWNDIDSQIEEIYGDENKQFDEFYMGLVKELVKIGDFISIRKINDYLEIGHQDSDKLYSYLQSDDTLKQCPYLLEFFDYMMVLPYEAKNRSELEFKLKWLVLGLKQSPKDLEIFAKFIDEAYEYDNMNRIQLENIQRLVKQIVPEDIIDEVKHSNINSVLLKNIDSIDIPPSKKHNFKPDNLYRSTRSADLQRGDSEDPGNKNDIAYDVDYDEEPDRLLDPYGHDEVDDIADPNAESEDDIIDRIDKQRNNKGIKENKFDTQIDKMLKDILGEYVKYI
jgi:hypothetical protein